MACHHEVRHRRRKEDPRRQMFDTQLNLLGNLSDHWRDRTRARLNEILRENPFIDP